MNAENICAIVVIFNPDNEIEQRLACIAKQVNKVVVVDNASSREQKERLSQICKALSTVLIDNKQNIGVATALNQGIAWAQENGFKWVITFDQDTLIDEGLIETLLGDFLEMAKTTKIASIGARYKESYHAPACTNPASKKISEVKTLITSGSLFSTELFNDVGMFRDELFIDCVDHEFCLRCRKLGYKVFVLNEYLMAHSIGNIFVHEFIGKQVVTTNHSALRRYYMMRNALIIFKKYFSFDPCWVTYNLYLNFKYMFIILLFEKQKFKKTKYIVRGLWHGIFSKY